MTPTDLEGLARECAKTWKTMRTSPCSDGSCDHVTEDMAALIIATFRPAFEAKDQRIEELLYASDKQTVAWKARALAAEQHLGNLLARIHRDGGHYQGQHGTAKAVEQADWIVSVLNTRPTLEEHDEAQQRAKAAEAEHCALCADHQRCREGLGCPHGQAYASECLDCVEAEMEAEPSNPLIGAATERIREQGRTSNSGKPSEPPESPKILAPPPPGRVG